MMTNDKFQAIGQVMLDKLAEAKVTLEARYKVINDECIRYENMYDSRFEEYCTLKSLTDKLRAEIDVQQLVAKDEEIQRLTADISKLMNLLKTDVKLTAKSSSEAPILQQGLFGNVTKDSLAEMFLHFSKTADKEELKSLVNVIRETLATRGLQIGEDSDV